MTQHAPIHALAPPREVPLARAALFLDLDGTLATFEARPSEVVPEPRRTALLKRLDQALEGRLAIVSGRTVSEIDRIVERSARCAAGTHGLERRTLSGELVTAEVHPGLPAAEESVKAFAADRPGLLVEEKSLSVGLHYRGAPHLADEVHGLAERLAGNLGLFLQRGDRVVELRTPGANKGDAIRAFMDEPPFSGFTPVFLGDDVTDEDGFRAVAALGGVGVLVGDARPTAAVARLPDVAGVLDWLEQSAGSMSFRFEVCT